MTLYSPKVESLVLLEQDKKAFEPMKISSASMSKSLQVEVMKPEVGSWLIDRLLTSDDSIRAAMLVVKAGTVIAHKRAPETDENLKLDILQCTSVLVPVPLLELFAFVRLAPGADEDSVVENVLGTLTPREDINSL